MHIKLIEDVKTEYTKTARGGYTTAFVNYEGAKYPYKLMSFSNPATFETLKDAKAGEEYEIDSVKEGQYFQWKSAKKAEVATKSAAGATTYTPTKSTYETPEERSIKQRLIVRQSSLAQAIAFYELIENPGVNPEAVKQLADEFTAWVYEAPDLFDTPNDLTGA